jgi:carbon storage regulator
MLVLTRKLMEKLFIGDDICVTVVRLEGGQVRLGIEAPREVTVVRAELVPERVRAYRASHRVQGPSHNHATGHPDPAPSPPKSPTPTPGAGRAEAPVRIPPASAHGIDSRRRGRSR